MTRRKRIALIVLALFGVGAVGLGVWVIPWVWMPAPRAEVEAEWSRVEQWAEAPPPENSVADLRALIGSVRLSDELKGLIRREGATAPELALETLKAEPQAWVAGLGRWHRDSAKTPRDKCEAVCPPGENQCRALDLHYLGLLALASSHGPEPEPRVEEVLHLAKALRSSPSLVESRIGFGLASEAIVWAKSRGADSKEARQLFARYEPKNEEIFAALARDSYCSVRFAEDTLRSSPSWGFGWSPWPGRITDTQRPPFGLVRVEREIAVAKLWNARRLAAGAEHKGDPNALAKALEEHASRDKLDKAALAKILAFPYSGQVQAMAKAIEEYSEWLLQEKP